MNVLHTASELHPLTHPVCLAIGFFDGVHLGHQQVIRQAMADAEQQEGAAVVVTFDRHPASVVAPDRAPPLIYSLTQKLQTLQQLGVPSTLLLHFDEALCRQPAETFIRNLVRDLGPIHSICVGSAFKFGHQRQGNVALLRRLGNHHGFIVHGLASVSLDNQIVSSTRIRQAIQTGNLDHAGQMLGRAWSLQGQVVPGDRRGRQLGFPTANLHLPDRILPPHGVYAAHVRHEKTLHRAVLNVGTRPTLQSASPSPLVEVHLLDFSGDLYGQELEIAFVARIRDEQRFASLEDLKTQIQKDIATAQTCFPHSH